MRNVIGRDGYAVQVVLPNRSEPGWAYTVGLHSDGLPELIVVGGLSPPDQHGVIRELAEQMRRGEALEPGWRVRGILDGFDLMLIEVAETTTEHFAVANRLQSGFRALQVVWPDHRNRFPWEPGYALPIEHQRVLGPPPSD